LAANGAAGGAGSTAAAIQADQAGANARRAAVRFLGTVDCHYYPEAEAALIAALRTDRSECVRLEAGLALSHGCCCTKSTIEALRICVSGGEKDGNPGETSPRVRIAAFNALQGCCSRGDKQPDYELPRPEPAADSTSPTSVAGAKSEADDEETFKLSPYYVAIERRPMRELLRSAQATLSQVRAVSGTTTLAARTPVTGNGSLMGLWARSAIEPQDDKSRALTPIAAQPTLAVGSTTFPSPAAQSGSTSPSVIYSASRDLPGSRMLPAGPLLRLPDPNTAESFGTSEMVPDSSLPNRRGTLY
jgi:hypothetical protein